MFVGKVIGTVWSTVKWPEMQGHKLLVVRPYHLAELRTRAADVKDESSPFAPGKQIETVVCIDLLDAGVGDDVVVAFGHAARVAAEAERSGGGDASTQTPTKTPPITPIDAAVVAIVDGYSLPRLKVAESP